jgi:hypothetical protein
MVVFPGVVRGRDFNTSAEMTPHVCLVDVICQRSKAPPPGFQPLQRQQEIPDSSTATRSAGNRCIARSVRSDYDDCPSYQLRTDLL